MLARYIVIPDGESGQNRGPTPNLTLIKDNGMIYITSLGGWSIYASDKTKVTYLSRSGIIIGDTYSHSNATGNDADPVVIPPDTQQARRKITESLWGDYVLILQNSDNPYSLSISRSPSPSCDIQCVYSLNKQKDFITSDISLATRLGLYKRQVDFDYLAHRLRYPNLKTSRTGLKEVNELLPGTTLEITERGSITHQHWNPWSFVDPAARYSDFEEAAAAVRSSIDMVIDAWASSDGSTLLELSGGLDSSIVGSSLKGSRARVACVTLTADTPGADERNYARLVSEMLRTELLVESLDFSEFQFSFPLPQQLTIPVIGPLQLKIDSIMESIAEANGLKSYFSGAGGDTIFAYLTNASPAADAFISDGLSTAFQTLRDLASFHHCTYWKAAHLMLRKIILPQESQFVVDSTFLSDSIRFPTPDLHPWLHSPKKSLPGDRQRIFELSATQFYRESCTRTIERRLRMPLLSQPVVETCLRTPSWMWFTGGQNRAVARRAFHDLLPAEIAMRKSKGSLTSYLGAFHRRNKNELAEFLLNGELHARQLLHTDALGTLKTQESGLSRETILRVFQLCALENWARQ